MTPHEGDIVSLKTLDSTQAFRTRMFQERMIIHCMYQKSTYSKRAMGLTIRSKDLVRSARQKK